MWTTRTTEIDIAAASARAGRLGPEAAPAPFVPARRLRDGSAVMMMQAIGRRAVQGARWLVKRYQERRAMRELAAMNDRMLADIGLSRSMITPAVRWGRAGPKDPPTRPARTVLTAWFDGDKGRQTSADRPRPW